MGRFQASLLGVLLPLSSVASAQIPAPVLGWTLTVVPVNPAVPVIVNATIAPDGTETFSQTWNGPLTQSRCQELLVQMLNNGLVKSASCMQQQ